MGGRRGGALTRQDVAWAVLGAGGCCNGAVKVSGRCQDGAGTRASALEGVWDAVGGGNGMFRTPSKRNVRESEIVLKTGQANLADKNNRQAKSSLFLVCKTKLRQIQAVFMIQQISTDTPWVFRKTAIRARS